MKRKIFIVLPVFNRLNFTKRCLSAIYNQTYKDFVLVLIDDGSSDGTAEFVQKKYPGTVIIKGTGNWWWTRSMYEGVRYALKKAKPEDYILEMNNDLYFPKTYFSELVSFAKKHKNSLIGSMCVKAQRPHLLVEAGIRIDWATGLVYGVAQTISQDIKYFKNMNYIGDLDALPGKGTLIPIRVIKKIGNFNYKLLPHYIADYEFACRAKRLGFKLLVDTKAVAKHYWEATGIYSTTAEKRISYIRAFSLLFGKKSMNNITDWFIFVILCCPRKYLLRNFMFTGMKLAKAVFSVFPFYYLKPAIKYLLIKYLQLKEVMYVLYLKIKQFPEYHLK